MYIDTTWTEYHSAGASILTAAPVPEADPASSVGAVLVVGFLVTITVIAFGQVLAPIAHLGKTLLGAAGAVMLTAGAFILLVIFMVM
ncbi:MAG TPA: hypothetical protein VFZ63_18185 [Jiangellaceae bacterium]